MNTIGTPADLFSEMAMEPDRGWRRRRFVSVSWTWEYVVWYDSFENGGALVGWEFSHLDDVWRHAPGQSKPEAFTVEARGHRGYKVQELTAVSVSRISGSLQPGLAALAGYLTSIGEPNLIPPFPSDVTAR